MGTYVKKAAAGLAILFSLALAGGCSQENTAVQAEAGSMARGAEDGQEARQNLSGGAGSLSAGRERGSFLGTQEEELLPEQKAAILAYMEAYYTGLALLEPQDLSPFFTEGAQEQVLIQESALNYVINLRKMQQTDLTLADYQYELDVSFVDVGEDGSVQVQLTETSIQNFSQHPNVDTELYNIYHIFQLQETEEGWKISYHLQRDAIYWNLLREYWSWDNEKIEIPQIRQYLDDQTEKLLTAARTEAEGRNEEFSWSPPEKCDFSYDRKAAVDYSSRWVGKRSPKWADYTGRGGNCQNYVSQCLFAGGIPMDDQGEEKWLWQGEENFVSSWVSVDGFYAYAKNNQGYGLAAAADVPYYEGEEGDLIRMGSPEDWNHIVIISRVIFDEQGNTVDYLVNSNTSDVKNFPVSAYPNPSQKLMKIYGWNLH